MTIRPVTPADRAEWLRMLLALYPGSEEPDHAPAADAFLRGEPHPELLPAAVFVAERPGGGLAGFAEISVRDYAEGCTGRAPYLESWYVDPDARGTGTGRALVAPAEAWARERGFSEMASDALIDNERSIRAHAALGFEEVERAVHFRKAL